MSYLIMGYKENPLYDDIESEPRKLYSKNKRSCVGAVKIMLDQFDCSYIEIFKEKQREINGDEE